MREARRTHHCQKSLLVPFVRAVNFSMEVRVNLGLGVESCPERWGFTLDMGKKVKMSIFEKQK